MKKKIFILGLSAVLVLGTAGALVACGETPTTETPTTETPTTSEEITATSLRVLKKPGIQVVGTELLISEVLKAEPAEAKLTFVSSNEAVVVIEGTKLVCVGEGIATVNVKSGKKEANLEFNVLTKEKYDVLTVLSSVGNNFTMGQIDNGKIIPAIVLTENYLFDGWFGDYSIVRLTSDNKVHPWSVDDQGNIVVNASVTSEDALDYFAHIGEAMEAAFDGTKYEKLATGFIKTTDRSQIDAFVTEGLLTISSGFTELQFKATPATETEGALLELVLKTASETMNLVILNIGTSSLDFVDEYIKSGAIPADTTDYTPLTKVLNSDSIVKNVNYTVKYTAVMQDRNTDTGALVGDPYPYVVGIKQFASTKMASYLATIPQVPVDPDKPNALTDIEQAGYVEAADGIHKATSVFDSKGTVTSLKQGDLVADTKPGSKLGDLLYTIGTALADGEQNGFLAQLKISSFFTSNLFNYDATTKSFNYTASVDKGTFGFLVFNTLAVGYWGPMSGENFKYYSYYDLSFTATETGLKVSSQVNYKNAIDVWSMEISNIGTTVLPEVTVA